MKYELRTAYIAKDYDSNDITDNVKIKIQIENNIIPANISQIFGKAVGASENSTEREPDKIRYRISASSEFTDKFNSSDVKSSLYEDYEEEDGSITNRFVYISHAYSILFNCYEVFWLDRKYGDILKIVDLTTLVDLSGDSKVVTRSNIILGEIVSLRVKNLNNLHILTPKISLDKVDRKITIKNVKDIAGIKTHLLKIKFANNAYLEINNSGKMIDNDNYIEGTWGTLVECYSLGGAEELFDQPDFNISSLRIHKDITLRDTNINFIGEQNLDDILIIR